MRPTSELRCPIPSQYTFLWARAAQDELYEKSAHESPCTQCTRLHQITRTMRLQSVCRPRARPTYLPGPHGTRRLAVRQPCNGSKSGVLVSIFIVRVSSPSCCRCSQGYDRGPPPVAHNGASRVCMASRMSTRGLTSPRCSMLLRTSPIGAHTLGQPSRSRDLPNLLQY